MNSTPCLALGLMVHVNYFEPRYKKYFKYCSKMKIIFTKVLQSEQHLTHYNIICINKTKITN